jgi:hypothetical protein
MGEWGAGGVTRPAISLSGASRTLNPPFGSDFRVWHNVQGVVCVLAATREG